ncbi:MAG: NUDIX domain-containing protein [Clostridia bacterium]|nr:NUDIX domain-containing protein [Clostridia bacterium]
MREDQSYCPACGARLVERPLEREGLVPYCERCAAFRFPQYNVAVSMIVRDERSGRILLIQQYGRPSYILVAGYVGRGERAEDAVVREIREETGLSTVRIRFNRTKFFEPSNTLMINFTAYVANADAIRVNEEIDRYEWFGPEAARRNIKPNSLAAEFLNAYLDDTRE